MSKYTHEQLCRLALPASETEETKLDHAIDAVKRALGNSDIILSNKYEIFGQGSYANNTNVRNNSDVDINVCYTAAYYYDLPVGKTREDYGFSNSVPYDYSTFKNDIERMLIVIISAIWYRLYRCFGTADSRCWIYRSGVMVPFKLSFFGIMVHQRA